MRVSTQPAGSWRSAIAAWAISWIVLAAPGRASQEAPAPGGVDAQSEMESVPDDPHGRGTPRGAMEGFLRAARAGRWADATQYLDLSRIPSAERSSAGEPLARQLKFLLDQRLWLDLDALSDEPGGDAADGLKPALERVGQLNSPRGDLDVILRREGRVEDGVPVWRVSAGTLARVPAFYDELGVVKLLEHLPRFLVDTRFLEVALWQWIGLMALAVAAWLAGWAAASVLLRLLRPLASRSATDVDDRLLALVQSPARMLAAIGAFNLGLPLLHLSIPAHELTREISKFLVIAAFAWLALRVIDLAATLVRERLAAHGRGGASHLVPLGARAVKIAVLGITVLATLDTFGFDVTAIIAGLGVGGLAVALAAQKTVENVFGGVSVLVDQPVRPGDFCRFGDKLGTVEDIGVRSTRIRTLDRTLISVPNAEFSNLHIENFAARDRIRLIATIGLRYETTPDQLRHAIAGMRRVLLGHPKVLAEPQRVRLVGFGASSLDLEVLAYVDTADYDEFLAIREDVYLRFMETVEASGTSFAFPSTTTYLARDGGLDRTRRERAEAEVARWRAEGRLMFPNPAADEVRALDDTLDWPPQGSAVRGAAT